MFYRQKSILSNSHPVIGLHLFFIKTFRECHFITFQTKFKITAQIVNYKMSQFFSQNYRSPGMKVSAKSCQKGLLKPPSSNAEPQQDGIESFRKELPDERTSPKVLEATEAHCDKRQVPTLLITSASPHIWHCKTNPAPGERTAATAIGETFCRIKIYADNASAV